jgi:hypothetical protein
LREVGFLTAGRLTPHFGQKFSGLKLTPHFFFLMVMTTMKKMAPPMIISQNIVNRINFI